MKVNKELVFEAGEHFASCHASTILPLENGDILVAYFAGTKEKDPDVGIWLSRRVSGVWQKPVLIAKDGEIPTAHWNPVLFEGKKGEIRICYKVGETIPGWVTHTRVSFDLGKSFGTWEEYSKEHPACGPVRSKPLVLSDRIIAPNSVETQTTWRPFVDVSFDGVKTFSKLSDIPINTSDKSKENYFLGKGAIQPTLWENDGVIYALLRTTEGWIFKTESRDMGKTWSEAKKTSMPNNNSGIETVQAGKRVYLICNPVSENWGARYPLNVYYSDDNCETFHEFLCLESEPTKGLPEGVKSEFSYPAGVYKNGKLYISYTYNRRQIAVVEVETE